MTKKYVLQEFMNLDYSDDLLTEEEREGNKQGIHLVLAGKIQAAGKKNGNGRIYPKPILEREMKNYTKLVREGRAIGELDHPDSSVVNLNNVSHNVLEMHWDGKDLLGTIEVLTTPSGNILRELFKSGIRLGISSRGLGSVEPMKEDKDAQEVQNDFELIAFDFVSNPSTHGAFMNPVNESVNRDEQIRSGKWSAVDNTIGQILRGE